MTGNDLRVELDNYLRQTEPHFGMNPDLSIKNGQATSRRRNTILSVGLAAAVTAAVIVAPTALDRPAPPTPSSSPSYSPPEKLPGIIQDEAQSVLGDQFGELPPAAITASTSGETFEPRDYSKATAITATFDLTPDDVLRVYVAQARSEAEGDLTKDCEGGVESGLYQTCDVTQREDVPIVVNTQMVMKQGRNWLVVIPGEPLPKGMTKGPIYLQRTVRAIRSDTLVSSATERVPAAEDSPMSDGFSISTDDLARLATTSAIAIAPSE